MEGSILIFGDTPRTRLMEIIGKIDPEKRVVAVGDIPDRGTLNWVSIYNKETMYSKADVVKAAVRMAPDILVIDNVEGCESICFSAVQFGISCIIGMEMDILGRDKDPIDIFSTRIQKQTGQRIEKIKRKISADFGLVLSDTHSISGILDTKPSKKTKKRR